MARGQPPWALPRPTLADLSKGGLGCGGQNALLCYRLGQGSPPACTRAAMPQGGWILSTKASA